MARSTNGDHTDWSDEDLIPLSTLKRLRQVVDWSSDDEIPLAELKRKRNNAGTTQQSATTEKRKLNEPEAPRKRPREDWDTDDELPLSLVRVKRRIQQLEKEAETTNKRPRNDWSSDDDIPLAILKEKRKRERGQKEAEPEPIARRLRKRKQKDAPEANAKRPRQELFEQTHHYAQGKRKRRFEATTSASPVGEPVEKIARVHEGTKSDIDRLLRSIYYDPKHPASFSSVKKLAEAAGVSTKAAKQWLSGEDTYTLTRQAKRKFKRRRYIVNGIGHLFQVDLVDMQATASVNDGYRYILTCIDCFTRRLWAIPVKDKTSSSIIPALKRIFNDLKPQTLSSDAGSEFINKQVQAFLKESGVKFYTTVDQMKSAYVERVNRTLRDRMTRFFSTKGSRRYVEVLPNIVRAYNLSVHSATGRKPLLITSKDVEAVWHKLYSGTGRYKALKYAETYNGIKNNDRVRLARIRGPFEKRSATYNWTPEVFTVNKVSGGDPPMYTVEDDKGRPIKGKLYKDEVQVINKAKDGTYLIDKIIGTRGRGASRELHVSWVGYGSEFDSWIKESELRDL